MREYIGIGTRNQQRGTLLSRLKSRVSAAPAPRGCHDAEARIKELEAQCEDLMQNCNSLRERAWKAEVRIKEQDDALVEERTGAIRCESYDHCEGMYRIDLPDAMIRAQQELQAEGKIGPDAAKPQSWQITEERKAAIDRGMRFLAWSNAKTNDPGTEIDLAVLRAMLTEAEQE